jgi:hypothetical protein
MSMLMMGIGGADPLAAAKAATRYYYGFQDSPNDTSGNGLHLTPVNSPTYVDGVIGRAANFVAASSQYFNVAHNDLMCPATGFALVCRFRLSSVGATRPLVNKFSAADTAQRSYIFWVTSGNVLQFFTRTTDASEASLLHGSVLSADTWYTAIAMWDGSQMSIRVNGVGSTATVAKTGTLINSSGASLLVGAYSSSAISTVFNGDIDQAWLIAKALTADEIAAIYALTTDPF